MQTQSKLALCSLPFALCAAGSLLAQGQQDFSAVQIKTHQVSGNVYYLEGQGGNVGLLIGDDGVLMIDDQFAPLSEKLQAAIKALSNKPIRMLINTHVHGDHFSAENLEAIFAKNPEAQLFTTAEVKSQFDKPNVVTPKAGDKVTIGPFVLEFFGGLHDEIDPLKPQAQNIGVLVNGNLYHPGDSLTVPDKPVNVLSLPSSAPWSKTSQTIQFLRDANPSNFFFPTRDGLLSENGKGTYNFWLTTAAEAYNFKMSILQPGDSVEI